MPMAASEKPDSHGSARASSPPDLNALWSEWTAVVNGYAETRRKIHPKLDAEAYKSLYSALLHGLQLKSAIGDESTRIVYRELHSLLLPWVSLGALGRAHRDVIISLLAGCSELGAAVGLHADIRKPSSLHRAGWLIGVAALAAGAVWFAGKSDLVSRKMSVGTHRLSEEVNYYVFRHLNTPGGLALGAVALTLVGIWMVHSLKKA